MAEALMKYTFQFTPLREGRRKPLRPTLRPGYFNSRPCVRGDGPPGWTFTDAIYFNSRPCVRGDEKTVQDLQGQIISIHAPA